MTDQGFIVKKDLAVGGNISGQGAFILGSVGLEVVLQLHTRHH
jgi:hypothetical protein